MPGPRVYGHGPSEREMTEAKNSEYITRKNARILQDKMRVEWGNQLSTQHTLCENLIHDIGKAHSTARSQPNYRKPTSAGPSRLEYRRYNTALNQLRDSEFTRQYKQTALYDRQAIVRQLENDRASRIAKLPLPIPPIYEILPTNHSESKSDQQPASFGILDNRPIAPPCNDLLNPQQSVTYAQPVSTPSYAPVRTVSPDNLPRILPEIHSAGSVPDLPPATHSSSSLTCRPSGDRKTDLSDYHRVNNSINFAGQFGSRYEPIRRRDANSVHLLDNHPTSTSSMEHAFETEILHQLANPPQLCTNTNHSDPIASSSSHNDRQPLDDDLQKSPTLDLNPTSRRPQPPAAHYEPARHQPIGQSSHFPTAPPINTRHISKFDYIDDEPDATHHHSMPPTDSSRFQLPDLQPLLGRLRQLSLPPRDDLDCPTAGRSNVRQPTGDSTVKPPSMVATATTQTIIDTRPGDADVESRIATEAGCDDDDQPDTPSHNNILQPLSNQLRCAIDRLTNGLARFEQNQLLKSQSPHQHVCNASTQSSPPPALVKIEHKRLDAAGSFTTHVDKPDSAACIINLQHPPLPPPSHELLTCHSLSSEQQQKPPLLVDHLTTSSSPAVDPSVVIRRRLSRGLSSRHVRQLTALIHAQIALSSSSQSPVDNNKRLTDDELPVTTKNKPDGDSVPSSTTSWHSVVTGAIVRPSDANSGDSDKENTRIDDASSDLVTNQSPCSSTSSTTTTRLQHAVFLPALSHQVDGSAREDTVATAPSANTLPTLNQPNSSQTVSTNGKPAPPLSTPIRPSYTSVKLSSEQLARSSSSINSLKSYNEDVRSESNQPCVGSGVNHQGHLSSPSSIVGLKSTVCSDCVNKQAHQLVQSILDGLQTGGIDSVNDRPSSSSSSPSSLLRDVELLQQSQRANARSLLTSTLIHSLLTSTDSSSLTSNQLLRRLLSSYSSGVAGDNSPSPCSTDQSPSSLTSSDKVSQGQNQHHPIGGGGRLDFSNAPSHTTTIAFSGQDQPPPPPPNFLIPTLGERVEEQEAVLHYYRDQDDDNTLDGDQLLTCSYGNNDPELLQEGSCRFNNEDVVDTLHVEDALNGNYNNNANIDNHLIDPYRISTKQWLANLAAIKYNNHSSSQLFASATPHLHGSYSPALRSSDVYSTRYSSIRRNQSPSASVTMTTTKSTNRRRFHALSLLDEGDESSLLSSTTSSSPLMPGSTINSSHLDDSPLFRRLPLYSQLTTPTQSPTTLNYDQQPPGSMEDAKLVEEEEDLTTLHKLRANLPSTPPSTIPTLSFNPSDEIGSQDADDPCPTSLRSARLAPPPAACKCDSPGKSVNGGAATTTTTNASSGDCVDDKLTNTIHCKSAGQETSSSYDRRQSSPPFLNNRHANFVTCRSSDASTTTAKPNSPVPSHRRLSPTAFLLPSIQVNNLPLPRCKSSSPSRLSPGSANRLVKRTGSPRVRSRTRWKSLEDGLAKCNKRPKTRASIDRSTLSPPSPRYSPATTHRRRRRRSYSSLVVSTSNSDHDLKSTDMKSARSTSSSLNRRSSDRRRRTPSPIANKSPPRQRHRSWSRTWRSKSPIIGEVVKRQYQRAGKHRPLSPGGNHRVRRLSPSIKVILPSPPHSPFVSSTRGRSSRTPSPRRRQSIQRRPSWNIPAKTRRDYPTKSQEIFGEFSRLFRPTVASINRSTATVVVDDAGRSPFNFSPLSRTSSQKAAAPRCGGDTRCPQQPCTKLLPPTAGSSTAATATTGVISWRGMTLSSTAPVPSTVTNRLNKLLGPSSSSSKLGINRNTTAGQQNQSRITGGGGQPDVRSQSGGDRQHPRQPSPNPKRINKISSPLIATTNQPPPPLSSKTSSSQLTPDERLERARLTRLRVKSFDQLCRRRLEQKSKRL